MDVAEPIPQIVTWCGKNIETMTRDELLVAFKHLAANHQRHQAEHLRQLSVLGEFRKARAV